MHKKIKAGNSKITLLVGDITTQAVDAVVNPANKWLLGGGGLDGAIHRAAGPRLLAECKTLGGTCPGGAKITKGYDLKARYIIHTVGPMYNSGKDGEAEVLRECYKSILSLVKEYNLTSVSIPAIATGVFRYPKKEAAGIAISTVSEILRKENIAVDVIFTLFGEDDLKYYTEHNL